MVYFIAYLLIVVPFFSLCWSSLLLLVFSTWGGFSLLLGAARLYLGLVASTWWCSTLFSSLDGRPSRTDQPAAGGAATEPVAPHESVAEDGVGLVARRIGVEG